MELQQLKKKLKLLRIIHYSILTIAFICFSNIVTNGNKAPLETLCGIISGIGLIDVIVLPIFINKLKSKIENIENMEIAIKDTTKNNK